MWWCCVCCCRWLRDVAVTLGAVRHKGGLGPDGPSSFLARRTYRRLRQSSSAYQAARDPINYATRPVESPLKIFYLLCNSTTRRRRAWVASSCQAPASGMHDCTWLGSHWMAGPSRPRSPTLLRDDAAVSLAVPALWTNNLVLHHHKELIRKDTQWPP